MRKEEISINGIDISIQKSVKAKRVNIRIKPFRGVLVSVPIFVSFNRAKKFIKQKIKWIESSLAKLKQMEDKLTVFNINTQFKTHSHHLNISFCDTLKTKSLITNDTINVMVPENADVNDILIQKEIRKGIEKALFKEASEYLPTRINYFANKHGLVFNKLKINNTKTRWGSCAYNNNINLNLQLMRLPSHLIDYVIPHELAHTKVKNHSIEFWNFLDSICCGAKKIDKEMKAFNPKIY